MESCKYKRKGVGEIPKTKNDAFDNLVAKMEKTQNNGATGTAFAGRLAQEFTEMLNAWHSLPEVKDRELDSQIHRWYVDPPQVKAKQPFFSPSSATADARQLYFKARGFAEDREGQQPQQGRWTRIGTAIGDIIQRDMLFIEKHGETHLGFKPRFRFVRNPDGTPLFEEFAAKSMPINYGGTDFVIHGSPDGIMHYEKDDGTTVRVGLEVKSKQTTSARTSLYSMREAEAKHEEQCVAYALMHDCDYYLILYVNTAHKSWTATEADAIATPDIRVFALEATKQRKDRLLARFAFITDCVNKRKLPPFEIKQWRFNSLKEACALSLSEAELIAIKSEIASIKASKAPSYLKKDVELAFAEILDIRANCDNKELIKKVYDEVSAGI